MPAITSVAPAPCALTAWARSRSSGSDFPVDDASDRADWRRCLREWRSRRRAGSSSSSPTDLEGRPRADASPGRATRDGLRHRSARDWATGLHQVDNPVFDRDGQSVRHLQRLARSGGAGLDLPRHARRHARAVRVGHRQRDVDGVRSGRQLYVSSRFEGAVYRVGARRHAEQVASDLGVACGLAFDATDRCTSAIDRGPSFACATAAPAAFATLPASVAAFHLAMSAEQELYVTAPTLACLRPHLPRRSERSRFTRFRRPFGRPQGLAFAPTARCTSSKRSPAPAACIDFATSTRSPNWCVVGTALVGVAFGPRGELVVASNETAYRFD